MAAGTVSVAGNVSGLPTGAVTFGPVSFSIPTPIVGESVVALSTGANTVLVPTGATFMLVTGPNAANPVPNPPFGGTVTLKGVTGDTGVVLNNSGFLAMCIPNTTTSVVLTASTATTVYVWFA